MLKRMVLLLLVVVWAAPVAAADQYTIVPEVDTGVVFFSHAPMEKFDGKTAQVEGELSWDPAALAGPVALTVRVDLASFTTGLSKRDKHMREDYLETNTYPVAVFRGGVVQGASAAAVAVGDTVTFELAGVLDLHGVKKDMVCAVELWRLSATEARGVARFQVVLGDYRIARPQFLLLKLAETQAVTVRLALKKDS